MIWQEPCESQSPNLHIADYDIINNLCVLLLSLFLWATQHPSISKAHVNWWAQKNPNTSQLQSHKKRRKATKEVITAFDSRNGKKFVMRFYVVTPCEKLLDIHFDIHCFMAVAGCLHLHSWWSFKLINFYVSIYYLHRMLMTSLGREKRN